MTRIISFIQPSPMATEDELREQAQDLWPGLDAAELALCGGDPVQIAGLIAQHTNVSIDDSSATLVRLDEGEPPFYFG
jgi:hypothetical protein